MIEGGPPAGVDGAASAQDIGETIGDLRAAGVSSKEAVADLMRRCGLARRAAYAAWHRED